jgi:cytochrome c oxidase cbb3-type subunit 1
MTANPTTETCAIDACHAADCGDASASCRLPVLALFLGAAFWLVVSSAFALLASVKIHAPGLLANCAWLTYGRVHAAHLNAFAYGFAAQAALGVTLWLLAQTGKAKLALPGGSFIAAKLWNIGVAIGVVAILAGNNTGFEFLEFPHAASTILFIAYLILALAGLLTYAKRTACGGVTPIFLVTALFWFPWIYVTATALLQCAPVRGVTQAVIAWWFTNNFLFVWLGLISIGALFYFAPKFAGRELHSRQLAIFALLIVIFFGSWSGVPASAPVPSWIPALSAFGALVSVSGVLAVIANLKSTMSGCTATQCSVAGKFFCKSLPMLLLFAIGNAVASFACGASLLDFTWFTPALKYLLLYGFVAMVLLGAIYHIAPQLTGSEYFCTRPVKIHFWFMLLGTVLLAGSLALAGVRQGELLKDPSLSAMDALREPLKIFRFSTMGDLLVLLGSLTLLVNLGGLLRAACKNCCCKSQGAEVKK